MTGRLLTLRPVARASRLSLPILHPASLQAKQLKAHRIFADPMSLAQRQGPTLQLLYRLAADILHVHGATSDPPEVWCVAVAIPRIHQSTFVSACDFYNYLAITTSKVV
jgi:hypothetical protein